jgi:propanol-preferring alcohol dehydrogenase
VTANTREDGRELLALADRIGIRPTTTTYPLDNVQKALADVSHDRVNGAAVIRIAPGGGLGGDNATNPQTF